MWPRLVAPALTLWLAPCLAGATTYVVDSDAPYPHDTIQWGLDSASDGDTVLVAAGVYTGQGNRLLRFNGKEVVLRGRSGPAATIIDLENQDSGIRCGAGVDSAAVVEGFTIRDGWGSGISCTSGACPRIRNCIIERCFGGQHGGGIIILNSSPTVSDVVIESNTSTDYGGGVYLEWSAARFKRVSIRGNESDLGAGMTARWSTATLEDCQFADNTAERAGGGMWLGGGRVHLKDVVFSSNSVRSGEGGGIYSTNTGIDAFHCEFSRNKARHDGGGAFVRGSDQASLLERSVFSENYADLDGGGVYLEQTTAAIIGITFDRNAAGAGGGAIYSDGAFAEVDSCTFYRNTAAIVGGGVGGAHPGDIDVARSTFCGNASASGAGLYIITSQVTLRQLIVAFSVNGRAVDVGGSDATTSRCCVFANEGGDSLDGMRFENLFEDPLICGAPDMDLTLAEQSPCLPSNNEWGVQIGAWGAGCVISMVRETTWGHIKAIFR